MPRMLLQIALCVAGIWLTLVPLPSWSRGQNVCDEAALWASQESGVPHPILRALTRAESGRPATGEPWPWTVNQAGKGYWFATEEEARGFVRQQLDAGVTNIDVGCFQLNYHWHADAFPSLKSMLDPLENARYAAAFLEGKYRQSGVWAVAAGAYHSGKAEQATIYSARFSQILAALGAGGENPYGGLVTEAGPYRAPRVNTFQLLMAGEKGGPGSLVPRTGGIGALLGEVP